jgi:hypothetical protein
LKGTQPEEQALPQQ